MNRLPTPRILPLLLAASALLAFATPVAADTNSCQTTTQAPCDFHCHANDFISIYLYGEVGEFVSGSAACGNTSVRCFGVITLAGNPVGCQSSQATTVAGDGSCSMGAATDEDRVVCDNQRLRHP